MTITHDTISETIDLCILAETKKDVNANKRKTQYVTKCLDRIYTVLFLNGSEMRILKIMSYSRKHC